MSDAPERVGGENGAAPAEQAVAPDLTFDFSTLKSMRDYRAAMREWNDLLNSDNYDGTYVFMARYIRRWSFKGNPNNVKSYDYLEPVQYGEVVRRFSVELASFPFRPRTGQIETAL